MILMQAQVLVYFNHHTACTCNHTKNVNVSVHRKPCDVQSLDQQFGANISRSLFQPHSQPPVELEGPCPASIATSSHALGSTATAAPDTSLAEGAAGLLAMASAADESDFAQV